MRAGQGVQHALRDGAEDQAQLKRFRDAEVLVTQEDVPVHILVPILKLLVTLVVVVEPGQQQTEQRDVCALHGDFLGNDGLVVLHGPAQLVQALQAGVQERYHVGEPLSRREVAAQAVVHQVFGLERRLALRLAGCERGLVGAQAVGVFNLVAQGAVRLPALAQHGCSLGWRIHQAAQVAVLLALGKALLLQRPANDLCRGLGVGAVNIAALEATACKHQVAVVLILAQRIAHTLDRVPAQDEAVLVDHPGMRRITDEVAQDKVRRGGNARGQQPLECAPNPGDRIVKHAAFHELQATQQAFIIDPVILVLATTLHADDVGVGRSHLRPQLFKALVLRLHQLIGDLQELAAFRQAQHVGSHGQRLAILADLLSDLAARNQHLLESRAFI